MALATSLLTWAVIKPTESDKSVTSSLEEPPIRQSQRIDRANLRCNVKTGPKNLEMDLLRRSFWTDPTVDVESQFNKLKFLERNLLHLAVKSDRVLRCQCRPGPIGCVTPRFTCRSQGQFDYHKPSRWYVFFADSSERAKMGGVN